MSFNFFGTIYCQEIVVTTVLLKDLLFQTKSCFLDHFTTYYFRAVAISFVGLAKCISRFYD